MFVGKSHVRGQSFVSHAVKNDRSHPYQSDQTLKDPIRNPQVDTWRSSRNGTHPFTTGDKRS